MGNIVGQLTRTLLERVKSEPLEKYDAFLSEACDTNPPAHGMDWYGARYRQLALDPLWFANSLVVNSEREGYGSQRIWLFSNLISDRFTAELVRGHSVDESRHSRMFIRLVELLFPAAVDNELRAALTDFSPGYTRRTNPGAELRSGTCSEDEILDEIVQLNLVEIRSLFLQLLMRPVVLAYCPEESLGKIIRILDSLLTDEIRHIDYSARCIERAAASGWENFLRSRMIDRQADLNAITCGEVGREEYGFCGGACKGCSRSRQLLSSLASRREV
jgi:hypothetical protein